MMTAKPLSGPSLDMECQHKIRFGGIKAQGWGGVLVTVAHTGCEWWINHASRAPSLDPLTSEYQEKATENTYYCSSKAREALTCQKVSSCHRDPRRQPWRCWASFGWGHSQSRLSDANVSGEVHHPGLHQTNRKITRKQTLCIRTSLHQKPTLQKS